MNREGKDNKKTARDCYVVWVHDWEGMWCKFGSVDRPMQLRRLIRTARSLGYEDDISLMCTREPVEGAVP